MVYSILPLFSFSFLILLYGIFYSTFIRVMNWFVFIKKFIVSIHYKIEIDQILSQISIILQFSLHLFMRRIMIQLFHSLIPKKKKKLFHSPLLLLSNYKKKKKKIRSWIHSTTNIINPPTEVTIINSSTLVCCIG